MRYPVFDKKLLLLLAFLLVLITIIGLIWWHYDMELRKIEQQKNELRLDAD
jgi:hypothetical protein